MSSAQGVGCVASRIHNKIELKEISLTPHPPFDMRMNNWTSPPVKWVKHDRKQTQENTFVTELFDLP